jgi:hypothetical protein
MSPGTKQQQQQQQPYRSTPNSRSSILNRAREFTRRMEKEEEEVSRRHLVSPTTLSTSSSSLSPPHTPSRGSGIHSINHHQHQNNNSNSNINRRQTTSPGSFDKTPRSTTITTSREDRTVVVPIHLEKENSANKIAAPAADDDDDNNNNNPLSYSYKKNRNSNNNYNHNHHHTMNSAPQTDNGGRPSTATSNTTEDDEDFATQQPSPRPPPQHQQQNGGEPVVSPELLVDALSGHEDGLLAIAERLMEHYDAGYDAMGEAIIDAFADVQKLFQHVVEAAHMEGAAFEASRREEEMKELRRKSSTYNNDNDNLEEDEDNITHNNNHNGSGSGPVHHHHDEFIDQDVKDCLNDAIRKGASLKELNKHEECYFLYEQACQSASALLPVDSDHRGRLQLSIARAESMTPDRGCAILRYAMDDVLRSGLRAGKIPLPDPSKRADVVLSKPKGYPNMPGVHHGGATVQSSEEALNSLVQEMKEILDAPVYKDTPLQDVSKRFWSALQDNQKISSKNEERLEHVLGKLKGDFLLARAVSTFLLYATSVYATRYVDLIRFTTTVSHISLHQTF